MLSLLGRSVDPVQYSMIIKKKYKKVEEAKLDSLPLVAFFELFSLFISFGSWKRLCKFFFFFLQKKNKKIWIKTKENTAKMFDVVFLLRFLYKKYGHFLNKISLSRLCYDLVKEKLQKKDCSSKFLGFVNFWSGRDRDKNYIPG